MKSNQLGATLYAVFFSFLIFAQPANDDPCSATPLSTSTTCSYTTFNSSGATATAGVGDPSCSLYSGGDVWFSITVPASGSVTIDAPNGQNSDTDMAIYSGTCGSLTELDCDNSSGSGFNSQITASGLTPGATIWIRIWGYFTSNLGTFDICVQDNAPPANDDPCNAQPLAVGSFCSYSTYSNANSTATTGVTAPGCGNYSGGDVWFSFVAPATGSVEIDTDTGVMTDGSMALYSGASCNSLNLVSCNDDSSPNGLMPLISNSTLTPGATYYIRMWEYGNNNNGTFDICITEVTACGNPANNDYCESPATLFQGTGSWSSTTSGVFSVDLPGNVNSIFCGSIENNSWYQFTAQSTTESFPITDIFNCTNAFGIQAQVYEITYDANGCCSNFTSQSNCYNPGNTGIGTITATGLTVGNQYMLMIDGYAGDHCDFTISGWTATDILPVDLVKFTGISLPGYNDIQWTTLSERDNDYFILERSYDGINFKAITQIEGNGNSSIEQNYNFHDENVEYGLAYYRLKQFDYSGEETVFDPISLEKYSKSIEITKAYPNPTSEILNFEIAAKELETVTLKIQNQLGMTIHQEELVLTHGINTFNYAENGAAGLYYLTIVNNEGEIIDYLKFIKK